MSRLGTQGTVINGSNLQPSYPYIGLAGSIRLFKECAVDILYVIGSFAYTAQMMSFCFVDCPARGGEGRLVAAVLAESLLQSH